MSEITLTPEQQEQLIEDILEAAQEKDVLRTEKLLKELVPEQIAQLLETTPPDLRHFIWEHVDPEQHGEVLAHLNEEVRTKLLETLNREEIEELAEDLETDDLADIAQSLSDENKAILLDALDEDERVAVETAMSYPEDTAGGLMNTDVISVRGDVTIETVMRYLRQLGELPDNLLELIVRDRHNHYLGVVKLSDLLTYEEDTKIEELLDASKPAVHVLTPARDVAKLFEQNDWVDVAVVDSDNHILGRITIDDVVDIIREEAEHAQMAQAGLDEDEDIFTPPLVSARRRAFWLGVNLLTAVFAAWVASFFEDTLDKIVALALMMPIVASMGGIGGTQTATIIIRAMAKGVLSGPNMRALIRKEILVGTLNGLFWAAVTGTFAWWWFGDALLGFVFGAAMFINLVAGAVAGALIPVMLDRFKIDPALASGLMLTTVTDTMGFFALLGLATVIILHHSV